MDTNKTSKQKTRNYWKKEEESIIGQWADKAQCYQWMHTKCRKIYQTKNAWYTIPVIIISTVTGTANFAQDRFPDKYKEYMIMIIGTLSIIAGIITTIYQFLKISELNEGHRAASISWGKFYNTLKTTMARHPLDRLPPKEIIKIYQDEYEHLVEISPDILSKVLNKFNNIFNTNNELVKPDICNKLISTQIFDMNDEERQKMINIVNNVSSKNKYVDTLFTINNRIQIENENDPENENENENNLNISIEDRSINSNVSLSSV